MVRKKSPQQEMGVYSSKRLGLLFSDWVVNSHDEEDFGFDFEIRPTEENQNGMLEVSPQNFFLQLKSSEEYDTENFVSESLPVETLCEDWLSASVPVVLALYELDSDNFYWCIIQDYCWDHLDVEKPGWREQETVTIEIERHQGNRLVNRPYLTSALSKTQERIAFRQHVGSLSDRSNSDWAFKTQSATDEEINEYKLERVRLAREVIERGNIAKGLSELINIYHLPEKDEGKLEAILTLLRERSIDHPIIAVAQNRFAQEGIAIAKKLERENDLGNLRGYKSKSLSYIRTNLVGAEFIDNDNNEKFTVIEVEDHFPGDTASILIAYVQYESGEFYDLSAESLHPPEFEFLDGGYGDYPLEGVCEEDEHDFNGKTYRKLSPTDQCDDCGFSMSVLIEYLGHNLFYSTGEMCAECGCEIGPQADETEYFHDIDARKVCTDCWDEFDEEFGVPKEEIGTVFSITCAECHNWEASRKPEGGICPDCGGDHLMVTPK